MTMHHLPLIASALLLTACAEAPAPDNPEPTAMAELVFPASFRAVGTEPFWAVHVGDDRLRYLTPEDQQGESVPFVREQTPKGEMAVTAEVDGKALMLTGRIEECSDGMSDRVYPYTVTLRLGEDTEQGCAWSSDL